MATVTTIRSDLIAADIGALVSLNAALDVLREVSTTATAIQTMALIQVALHDDDITAKGISDAIGLTSSGISAVLATLSKSGPRNLGDGWGVIEYRENPIDRREKFFRLTPKGRALMRQIVNSIRLGRA